MIRADLMRAKSVKAASDHRREVVALGKSRVRDAQAREGVRKKENRFWQEIARASTASVVTGVSPGGTRAAALHRAMEAHHTLAKAKGAQRRIAGEIEGQVARVIKAEHIVTALEKARTKDRLIRAHKLAERHAEEVDEVALLRRGGNLSALLKPPRHSELRADSDTAEVATIEGFCSQHIRQGDLSLGTESPAGSGLLGTAPSTERGSSLAPHLVLQSVSTETKVEAVTLRVHAETSGMPLSCRLEATATAPSRVGIVLESPQPTLVRALEREQRGILRKLSESGIKVGGFEVRREVSMSRALSEFLRRGRRSKEEGDEHVIA